MSRRQNSPRFLRPVAVFAWLALLTASILPLGAVVLTNGSEFVIPDRTTVGIRTIFNGEDGYTVFVPPGAKSVRILYQTTPNNPIEILARQHIDIGQFPDTGFPATGNKAADFRDLPNNLGLAEMNIRPDRHPGLTSGTLFIGFITRADVVTWGGTLTVFVDGGPVDTLFPVAESTFRTGVDGWTRNATAAPYPGGTAGAASSFLTHETERGNPDGFLKYTHRTGNVEEYYVAPDKFLVDLLELDDARFSFDLARINGSAYPNYRLEIRVFSDEGGWKWIGTNPPPIPAEFEFFADEVPMGWRTTTVPIRKDFWLQMNDLASFEEVMSNPKRIEIRAAYVVGNGSVGLDNVQILARGDAPPMPVLPILSSFSGGPDRWDRNSRASEIPGASVGDAESELRWSLNDGNPGGRIVLAEEADHGGPADDAFVAPREFIGIYSGLDSPRFEFDYKHIPFNTEAATRPVTIRIFGSGAVYEWTGAVPINAWAHQTAPLSAPLWRQLSGTVPFSRVLESIERIEVSADQAEGRERNGLDNFALLTADSPPLPMSITAGPGTLSFSTAATDPSPAPQTVSVSAAGGPTDWVAEVTGEIADAVSLSNTTGEFPADIEVSVDTSELAQGEYSFRLWIREAGSTLTPAVVFGTVTVDAQPRPTPVISSGGVVHAATYRPQLAAGALCTIFGENLGGPSAGMLSSYQGQRQDRLPTVVNGARILVYETFGEVIAEAPILFINDDQINFQLPYEALGRSEVHIVVVVGGARSEPYPVQVTPSAPGVFTHSGSWAIAVNQDGTLNGPDNPAARTKPMTVYVTGQGQVSPEWPTGRAATAHPLIHTPNSVRAYIGGAEAHISFVGLAPGMVGVLQINLEPSFQTPVGDQPMIINIGGFESNAARVQMR